MDLYISKSCPHCHQLLLIFKENKHLIPYFNIMDIESNPYPKSVTSVPTLIKDGQLFLGDKLNAILNDVNQFHISQNGQHQRQPQGQHQRQPQGQHQRQPQEQPQRQPDEREMQMQQFSNGGKGPNQESSPGGNNEQSDGDIMGVCLGEDCMFESIDNSNSNNLMDGYCFLDDGYSENKPQENNNNGGKTGRFDNSAYEAMMKDRKM
jgi:hypothetical protein